MKKCRFFSTVLLLVMVAGILACALNGPAFATEKTFNLTMGVQGPFEAAMNKVVHAGWFKWLERESNGRLKFTLYPSEQAAKAPRLYDAARTGIVDIANQCIAFAPDRFPLIEVVMLPLMFEFPGSRAAALTATALYEKYPEIQAEFKGVKVLNFHANGPSHIHTTKKPVRTLDDLKGMVLISLGKWGALSTQALGATPEVIFPGEAYDALAKGVATGNVVEWEGQAVFHWYEVTNYSTEVGISLTPFVNVMNLNTWNSLGPDLQKLFTGKNMWTMAAVHGHEFDKDDIMFKDMINKAYQQRGNPEIYVLPKEERAKWIEAIMPLREEWVKRAVASGVSEAKAREILADADKFSKQFAYKGVDQDAVKTLRDWGAFGY